MSTFTDDILKVIRATRAISLPDYGRAEAVAKKSEIAADVVTRIDLAVEEYLATELGALDSGIAFFGEEGGGDKGAKRHWLVDPIDGTGHYVHGLPFCTTMLALVEDGAVTFSVIYDFVNDVMYHAERGKGAWRESERLNVSSRGLGDAYLIYEGRITEPEKLAKFMEFKKRRIMIFNFFASGVELAAVASGKLEGKICFDPFGKDYDFAPGTLLIREAGGVVANLGKTTYDHTDVNFIAANPVVYAALTEGPDAIFPIA